MKKWLIGIVPLIMLVTMCAGGAKPAANPVGNYTTNSSGMMTLDQALKEAADRIDGRVAAKTKIAPLNFNSPHDKFSGYVLDEVTANLVDSGKLTVVDRKEVDLIRGELGFQFSGEVGDDSMQQLGRMLGAQSIISGSLTDMGGFYRIVIRVLNVQNASVEVQYRANIADDKVMAALLTGGKTAVAARSPQRTSAASTSSTPVSAPAAPPAPVYKIGDKGPAGGLIFYDKGNNSGGWRYLEAAPAELEFIANWGRGNMADNVSGTNIGVGQGKENTQVIATHMRRNGESGSAAQSCQQFNHGGYDDWFLPSQAELNMMFINLKKKKLGGFADGWYWSSSQSGGYSSWAQNFDTGEQSNNDSPMGFAAGRKENSHRVRPIRQF